MKNFTFNFIIQAILNNLKENERIVLHNQMTLLNPDSFENIHPVYLVLLTNSILISYPNPTNSKYQFSLVSNQHLNDIAIINVKNSSRTNMNQNAGHVFQLLIFPEQIFVKCESARTKRDWLDTIEELKRKQQELGALVRQATIKGFV
jgi:hypothetical protein